MPSLQICRLLLGQGLHTTLLHLNRESMACFQTTKDRYPPVQALQSVEGFDVGDTIFPLVEISPQRTVSVNEYPVCILPAIALDDFSKRDPALGY
jgi:hypothetical protein